MRIAISTLSGVGYGGMTYFSSILPALARVDCQNEYHVFTPQEYPLANDLKRDNFIFHRCMGKNSSGLQRFWWEQIILPHELARHQIDIMFTAKNITIFRAPCKTVISIRNMEPFRYREYKNEWRLNLISFVKYQMTKWSLKRADGVVAPSRAVKEYIEERFPRTRGKMTIVYNGNPVTPRTLQTEHRGQPFILTSSKFVSYANQINLIEGYARLLQRMPWAPPLWFAGGAHDKKYFHKITQRVKELKLENKVRFLGLIPHETLLDLYPQAAAFIFPSTLEACPHTLIEALACGVPIASSNTPPMPEIATDAAIYFDPHDPEKIARTIKTILTDEKIRAALRQKGPARAQYFTWDKTADGLVRTFEHTITIAERVTSVIF